MNSWYTVYCILCTVYRIPYAKDHYTPKCLKVAFSYFRGADSTSSQIKFDV